MRTNSRQRTWRRHVALLLGLFAASLPAQSEDPTAGSASALVFQAFPEANSYRQIVRDVDQAARTEIERLLPFKVHFDELGPHTLFVPFRGRRPVGLLYLRHEEAEWGLTEIAWALTLDLHVVSFRFLRGRNRHQRELESSAFARQLAGADLAALEGLLAGETTTGPAPVPQGAAELAGTTLRSGIKALLVTDTVWRDEIAKLQDLGMGFDAFPTAERFHRRVLQFRLATGDTQQDVAASVVRATGKSNAQLGVVVRTEATVAGTPLVLRWVVDDELRLLRIVPARSWPSDELRLACLELEGQLLPSLMPSDNQLRPMACGLAHLLTQMNKSRSAR